ncbi:hypothetical protein VTK56DRAFT_7467 [Thermocarpiscus australiensis]
MSSAKAPDAAVPSPRRAKKLRCNIKAKPDGFEKSPVGGDVTMADQFRIPSLIRGMKNNDPPTVCAAQLQVRTFHSSLDCQGRRAALSAELKECDGARSIVETFRQRREREHSGENWIRNSFRLVRHPQRGHLATNGCALRTFGHGRRSGNCWNL